MAAKKQSKSNSGRGRQAAPTVTRFPTLLSTCARSMLNMIAVVATSGSVMVFLLTAKRFL